MVKIIPARRRRWPAAGGRYVIGGECDVASIDWMRKVRDLLDEMPSVAPVPVPNCAGARPVR